MNILPIKSYNTNYKNNKTSFRGTVSPEVESAIQKMANGHAKDSIKAKSLFKSISKEQKKEIFNKYSEPWKTFFDLIKNNCSPWININSKGNLSCAHDIQAFTEGYGKKKLPKCMYTFGDSEAQVGTYFSVKNLTDIENTKEIFEKEATNAESIALYNHLIMLKKGYSNIEKSEELTTYHNNAKSAITKHIQWINNHILESNPDLKDNINYYFQYMDRYISQLEQEYNKAQKKINNV